MSRPRNFWYPYVVKMIKRYPKKLQADGTMQAAIAEIAIRKALSETLKMRDGEERVRVVEMVYIKQTHTMEAAASQIPVSERTAQRWSQVFIYLCAKHMGMR